MARFPVGQDVLRELPDSELTDMLMAAMERGELSLLTIWDVTRA